MSSEAIKKIVEETEATQPIKASEMPKPVATKKTRKAKVIKAGKVEEVEVPADAPPANAVLLTPEGKIKVDPILTKKVKVKKVKKEKSTAKADAKARIPEGFAPWTEAAEGLGVHPPDIHKLIKNGKIEVDKVTYKPFAVIDIAKAKEALAARPGKAGRGTRIDPAMLVSLFKGNIGKPIDVAEIAKCGTRASKSLQFYNTSQAGKKGGAYGATAAVEAGVVWDNMVFDENGYVATVTVKLAKVNTVETNPK